MNCVLRKESFALLKTPTSIFCENRAAKVLHIFLTTKYFLKKNHFFYAVKNIR